MMLKVQHLSWLWGELEKDVQGQEESFKLSATGSGEKKREGKTNLFSFIFFNSPEWFKALEAAAELLLYLQARHSSYTNDNSPTAKKNPLRRRGLPSEWHFFQLLFTAKVNAQVSTALPATGLLSPWRVDLTPTKVTGLSCLTTNHSHPELSTYAGALWLTPCMWH